MSLVEKSRLDALREEWVGREFDEKEFEVSAERALEWARACKEKRAEFSDPNHPHYQVPVTFTAQYTGRRAFPEELVALFRLGRPFDAGKQVQSVASIRPGERLIGRSEIHDIYEKSGRSGSMIFVVHRMTFASPEGELKSIVDWRMVVRENMKKES